MNLLTQDLVVVCPGEYGRQLVDAARPLAGATLLFLKSGKEPRSITVNGRPAQGTRWSLHGFEFDSVTVDIAGELKVQVA